MPAPIDDLILQVMAARPSGIMTYAVRNILAHEHGMPDLKTPAVRNRLVRLEREGKVTCKRWGPGCHNEWRRL
ncbi:hypothetical protein [Sphingomonas aracearum]|uniref:Uncharacterized protein n=1 Tax=Sphingomonas aracearum TaxID=2283317 RepID=A0A369VRK6_9SPHN|nr:hypothetical protein [Sphingomonas aracearum]RDE04663.1 hypothetical protein DVW87_13810 [Sphingomonas aracearum]